MSNPTNIIDFKNIHQGKRCFIIGNGPSLQETPLEELNSEYTFATNKINKIYSETDWRPTYFSYTQSKRWAKNNNLYKNVNKTINEGVTCFIAPQHSGFIEQSENVLYYSDVKRIGYENIECLGDPHPPDGDEDYWSSDINNCIYQYCSSISAMYQLACYMGFKKIYLLGCDLGMDTTNHMLFLDARDPYIYHKKYSNEFDSNIKLYTNFILNSGAKSILNAFYFKIKEYSPFSSKGHEFHFTNDYQAKKLIKRGTDDKQRRAHYVAKWNLTKNNVEIYNATNGGELELFPRVNLEDIL